MLTMGFLGWLKDKATDNSIDEEFVELEKKFTEEWDAWAREKQYSVLIHIPEDFLKTS